MQYGKDPRDASNSIGIIKQHTCGINTKIPCTAADLPAVIKLIPTIAPAIHSIAEQVFYQLSPAMQCGCKACKEVQLLLLNSFKSNASFVLNVEAAQHISRYLLSCVTALVVIYEYISSLCLRLPIHIYLIIGM